MSYQGWSDFRSDTVTRPTAEMRKAMAECEVGDDVFGDDPTVIALEELAAGMLGKEAALFVPSGTMGNTIALRVHPCREKEVMVEEKSHIYNFEAGNIAHLAGAVPRPLPSDKGIIPIQQFTDNLRAGTNPHHASTAGICLENSHNYHGGSTLPLAYLETVRRFASANGLFLHLDGARIFNAAAYLKTTAAEIGKHFDSLMFCLSKGLAAPVGSLLAGGRDFIREARRDRKRLGGGMRQVGILAAAGLISLKKMTLRLDDDHRRARYLAQACAAIPGLEIDPGAVQTNIVILRLTDAKISTQQLVQKLQEDYVLAIPFGSGRLRMVTHHDIDDRDVEKAIAALRKAMKELPI